MYKNYEYIFITGNDDKNLEDLIIDMILHPKAFKNVLKQPYLRKEVSEKYNVDEDILDELEEFVYSYKNNIFNLLANMDVLEKELNKKYNQHLENDFPSLVMDVILYKFENGELDAEDIIFNLEQVANSKNLKEIFKEEITYLLKKFIRNIFKNESLCFLSEKNISRLENIIIRIFDEEEDRKLRNIFLRKINMLKEKCK